MANKFNIPDFDEFISDRKPKGVSKSYDRNPLDFSHPVDSKIMNLLESREANRLFEKYADAAIDFNMGPILESGIRITDKSSPKIYAVLKECAEKLNIPIPYTVISSDVKGFNVKTFGTDEFASIAISSLFSKFSDEDELRFILGHECGHIALGHVLYTTVANTGSLGDWIPVVGDLIDTALQFPLKAWYRRAEISADRAGLICCGNLNAAKRSLLRFEAGFMNIDSIDTGEYLRNASRFRKKNSLGKFKELFHEHPIIPKRMEALELFAHSEKYYRCSKKAIPDGKRLLNDEELAKETEDVIRLIGQL